MNQIVKQQIQDVGSVLEKMKPQLEMALPKHLTPDRMVRIALAAVNKTPKLLQCDRSSLLAAIMTSAQLGLEPDGTLGQAYLIPFGKTVQFIPGYKGLIALARNSGEVSSMQAQAVYEGDHFDYGFGLNERLDHTPSNDADRMDRDITHFWAMARFKDGGHHWDVLPVSEVIAIRDASQGYKSAMKFKKPSPWTEHFAEMGKKTAIRRIAKYLPMDVQKAAYISASYDRGEVVNLDQNGNYTEGMNFTAPAEEEGEVIEGQAEVVPDEQPTKPDEDPVMPDNVPADPDDVFPGDL